MRFTLGILALVGALELALGLSCYASHAIAPSASHVSFDYAAAAHPGWEDRRVESNSGWGGRMPSQSPSGTSYYPAYQQPPQTFQYTYPQVGVDYHSSPDFDWSEYSMALVMLVGGTLVCRRIFKNAPIPSRRIRLRQSPQAFAPYSGQGSRNFSGQAIRLNPAPPRPPIAVAATSRLCPRADCGRMNPPEAQYCRRCGAALGSA